MYIEKFCLVQLLLFTAGSEPGLNFCCSAFSPHLSGSHKSQNCFLGNAPSPVPPPPSSSREKREAVLPVTAALLAGPCSLSDWLRACAVASGATQQLPAEDHGAFSGSLLCFLDAQSTRSVGVPRLRSCRGFSQSGNMARRPAARSGTEERSLWGC